MDCRANSDLFFLADEKFDFDVSLSPASSTGGKDEDEVFLGPVTHKEMCVSVNVSSQLRDDDDDGGGGDVRVSWSPLTGDQLEAVCQEAHRLATQLQCGEQNHVHSENEEATNTTTDEVFFQDAEDKLGVLSQTASALSPIKRETFCVKDSPMKQLPPAVQRQLLRGSSAKATLSTLATATSTTSSTRFTTTSTSSTTRANAISAASSLRPTARLSTSSPVVGSKVQHRMSLRGKASLSVVLPNKPAAPTTQCSANKSKVEKSRLQPPSKPVGGWRRSPVSRASSRADSYEDLLSDSASVASDISDSSLNSSLLGKRTLAPPTKSAVRNLPGVKAPSIKSRRVADRKNTSSSSSSVSSFNSSMSLSPAKGKANSSLNRSLSGSTGLAPSSVSRIANPRRARHSTVSQPVSSTIGHRSLSTQARKLPEVEHAKSTRSTPLKRADTLPIQPTPPKRVLNRTTSIPPVATVRLPNASKAKHEALVVPTPTGGFKGVRSGDDASKLMKPKRLSVSCISSLPQKPAAAPLTPSAGDSRFLQVKARRPSALPTPMRRKMSAIATPTSHTRSPRLPPMSDTDPAPCSTSKEGRFSPVPLDTQSVESADAPVVHIQPFSLEEEEVEMVPPAAPPCCATQPDQLESTDPSETSRNLIEPESAEDTKSTTEEVLLLDLPAPALHPQEKLLIDLTNTPDLIRTSSKTCTTTQQLIDLSSPLIKWSPEDKKENNAPLINLSF